MGEERLRTKLLDDEGAVGVGDISWVRDASLGRSAGPGQAVSLVTEEGGGGGVDVGQADGVSLEAALLRGGHTDEED